MKLCETCRIDDQTISCCVFSGHWHQMQGGLNFIIVMRKYARILQCFMETECLPSVGFLTLSLLFWPLVCSVLLCFSADYEEGISNFRSDRLKAACFCEQKTEVKLKSFWATMTNCLWQFMRNTRQPWNQDSVYRRSWSYLNQVAFVLLVLCWESLNFWRFRTAQ